MNHSSCSWKPQFSWTAFIRLHKDYYYRIRRIFPSVVSFRRHLMVLKPNETDFNPWFLSLYHFKLAEEHTKYVRHGNCWLEYIPSLYSNFNWKLVPKWKQKSMFYGTRNNKFHKHLKWTSLRNSNQQYSVSKTICSCISHSTHELGFYSHFSIY